MRVSDLVEALQKIDQSLPVLDADELIPGWFEVVRVEAKGTSDEFEKVDEYVVLGCFLDSCYAQMHDHLETQPHRWDALAEDAKAFGGLVLPEDWDRDSWRYGD